MLRKSKEAKLESIAMDETRARVLKDFNERINAIINGITEMQMVNSQLKDQMFKMAEDFYPQLKGKHFTVNHKEKTIEILCDK